MQVTRIDLADRGSPEALVGLILKHEPDLPVPVPIEDLSRQLDIEDIVPLDVEGFEGGLITDTTKSRGVILVRHGARPARRRFTIGHELGHFLMPSHMPGEQGRFLCSREDMVRLTAKENDRREKMEVEANRFASLILMPPPFLRKAIARERSPSLQQVFALAAEFDVSKESMARAYADHHPDDVAFVVVRDGQVLRTYRNRNQFPFITVRAGQPVPTDSLFHKAGHQRGTPSDIDSRPPGLWIDVEHGRPAPVMSEQVCLQVEGFALIMLWHESAEAEDEDEDREEGRTSRERWKDRQSRYDR
ncbi:MAG: ImmA/IrrE family metallo-endopeptidase [Methyloceanibacter sp.]|uniref:ImmA/IrrE family metallo-endopeptidase n=1 Tax=Methyloceanibacter sp. TaxID=1965321 RepID=UPI003D6CCD1A